LSIDGGPPPPPPLLLNVVPRFIEGKAIDAATKANTNKSTLWLNLYPILHLYISNIYAFDDDAYTLNLLTLILKLLGPIYHKSSLIAVFLCPVLLQLPDL
jgi:hypothetical protein